jgi:hypothetical protein
VPATPKSQRCGTSTAYRQSTDTTTPRQPTGHSSPLDGPLPNQAYAAGRQILALGSTTRVPADLERRLTRSDIAATDLVPLMCGIAHAVNVHGGTRAGRIATARRYLATLLEGMRASSHA